MGADAAQKAVVERERLTPRDRWIVAGLTLLAAATAASAGLSSLEATLKFFGEQPTAREEAIASQATIVGVWALVTPLCGWALLRKRSGAVWGIVAWFVLLASCSWWAWPPPPSGGDDTQHPFWHSGPGGFGWALTAAGLAVGVYAALRDGRRTVRTVALVLSSVTVLAGAVSFLELEQRAGAEEPVTLPEGPAELAALERDALWSALPSAPVTYRDESPAARAPWGERFSTSIFVTLGNSPDTALFEQVVAVAEQAGWTFHDSNCLGADTYDATFTKMLEAGAAYLRVSVAPYLQGVDVSARVAPPPGPPGGSGRCWETTFPP